jgi:hypothetical protein
MQETYKRSLHPEYSMTQLFNELYLVGSENSDIKF